MMLLHGTLLVKFPPWLGCLQISILHFAHYRGHVIIMLCYEDTFVIELVHSLCF